LANNATSVLRFTTTLPGKHNNLIYLAKTFLAVRDAALAHAIHKELSRMLTGNPIWNVIALTDNVTAKLDVAVAPAPIAKICIGEILSPENACLASVIVTDPLHSNAIVTLETVFADQAQEVND
jgi:hypothetical protein